MKNKAVPRSVVERLGEITGGELEEGRAALECYRDCPGSTTRLVRVKPGSVEEAQDVMVTAAESGLPVYTVRTEYAPRGIEEAHGVLFDPQRLDSIKKIDAKNMMAYIGAGVTFEQLAPELEKEGVKLLAPACARSRYVVRSYLDRDILVGSSEHRQQQLSIFHALLADGRLWASGTHQMGEEGHADFREDQGPQFSPFFSASEDIYGVPVYGIVYLYPVREERRVLAFGFEGLEEATGFAYKVCREEHCFEIAGGDPAWWRSVACEGGAGDAGSLESLHPWTVLMSIEHDPQLVELQEGLVEADARAMGGEPVDGAALDALSASLGRPWYLWDRRRPGHGLAEVFCYTFGAKVAGTLGITGNVAREKGAGETASCFVPVYHGGAFYCESDIHFPNGDGETAHAAWRESYKALLELGSLVDKPTGELAEMVFAGAKPSYLAMIKRLKRILDPEGRLNPGQLLEGI